MLGSFIGDPEALLAMELRATSMHMALQRVHASMVSAHHPRAFPLAGLDMHQVVGCKAGATASYLEMTSVEEEVDFRHLDRQQRVHAHCGH